MVTTMERKITCKSGHVWIGGVFSYCPICGRKGKRFDPIEGRTTHGEESRVEKV